MQEPQARQVRLEPGLHFIATPIGAARDITLRALDILASADVLAAEDTRSLRHLMEIHGIPAAQRPVIAYHEHNNDQALPGLLAALAAGKSVAYASEAGTPLVSDPGFQLGRAAIQAGYVVRSAPGPSAVLAALTVSGLPSDRFLFAGFPPATGGSRRTFLENIARSDATVILYESPKRIQRLLEELLQIAQADRPTVVCRELTKRFEEVTRGDLATVREAYSDREVKGEIVLLLGRAPEQQADAEMLDQALRQAMREHRIKEAAALVAGALGLPRREVYQRALKLSGEE